MHINDLYEQQAKDLLHRLCDALGIEQEDRTRARVEEVVRELGKLVNLREYVDRLSLPGLALAIFAIPENVVGCGDVAANPYTKSTTGKRKTQ